MDLIVTNCVLVRDVSLFCYLVYNSDLGFYFIMEAVRRDSLVTKLKLKQEHKNTIE